jgi:hypothetical protein
LFDHACELAHSRTVSVEAKNRLRHAVKLGGRPSAFQLIPARAGVDTSWDVGLGFHGDDFLSVMNRGNPSTLFQTQFAGQPIHVDPACPVWDTSEPGLIAAAQPHRRTLSVLHSVYPLR